VTFRTVGATVTGLQADGCEKDLAKSRSETANDTDNRPFQAVTQVDLVALLRLIRVDATPLSPTVTAQVLGVCLAALSAAGKGLTKAICNPLAGSFSVELPASRISGFRR